MARARTVLLCLALLGCQARRGHGPDWVTSAPPATVAALSVRADWALRQPQAPALLARYPAAGLALAAFLSRARIDPDGETGRITVYLPDPAGDPGEAGFLIQLGGFRNPGKLQVAIADAFQAEGDLPRDKRDLPLFVVLDRPSLHIRAMADADGRVWLGDLPSLVRLGSGSGRDERGPADAVAWVGGGAAVQGFLRPGDLAKAGAGRLPGDFVRDLPKGIDALAWGVTPGSGPDALIGFELSLTGSRDAIRKGAPWLQRFIDAAQATPQPGAAAQVPEILQKVRRIGLRCRLTQAQLDTAMARLELPSVQCR